MNLTEHLLTCLAEECAEVQQAVAKAQRFGLDDGYPGTQRTNRGDITRELNDLIAVVGILVGEGVLPEDWHDEELGHLKQQRVVEFLRYARKVKTLQEP